MADRKGISGPPNPAISASERPQKPKRNKYAFACAILASLTSILVGYDIGVMSGAGMYIQEDLKISDVKLEVLMGILNVYSLIGYAATGRTSDWIGRRYTIVLASALFLIGALLMGFATNYAFLMVGRFVTGIGVDYALMIAPVYTAELSPASSRGFLTSLPEVFINAGILLGYVSNYAFSKLPLHLGWRLMLGIGALPAVFLAVGVLEMPESPRWLVLQGRLGDAEKVLDRTSDSKEEALRRLADIKEAAGIPPGCNDDVVAVPQRSHGKAVRHILIAVVGIHFFQQTSGIDAVVLYSPKIFEKAGITSQSHKLLATVAVGFIKTTFILLATFLLDRIGRRPLLLASVGGMIVSLASLGIALTIIERSDTKLIWAITLAIASVLAYVATFSIGIGPITLVYSSEILPLHLRARGTSIVLTVNRVMSGIISMTFLSFSKAITIGGVFFFFTGVAIAGFVFFYTLLPETQGKTLEEMEILFGTFFKWRSTVRELGKNNRLDGECNGYTNSNSQIQLGQLTAK
ncbi:Polyol transporter like [Actinidia chinensis var. chinensis]|uniref:Polyol transporter like n=1 Tax=Actinidia chinensis var. chinensis TaxID=1590841 RepID=A0A2R6RBZ1_ACTCC|nr:Polyol transporter like [Actinidia chinensis var. chinensis]